MPPTYDYLCSNCTQKFIENVKYEERDRSQPCPECGTASPRTMAIPIIRSQKLSASFVDGSYERKRALEDYGKAMEAKIKLAEVDDPVGDEAFELKHEIEERTKLK